MERRRISNEEEEDHPMITKAHSMTRFKRSRRSRRKKRR
jgi:hypothetical protein